MPSLNFSLFDFYYKNRAALFSSLYLGWRFLEDYRSGRDDFDETLF